MPRMASQDVNVAYFSAGQAGVKKDGFYVVDKEASDNDGKVVLGKQVYPHDGWFVYEAPDNNEGGEG